LSRRNQALREDGSVKARRSTFIEQTKDLVDDLHGGGTTKPQKLTDAHKIIDSITYYDSIMVVEKRKMLAIDVGCLPRAQPPS
jgi:hypothetical protein